MNSPTTSKSISRNKLINVSRDGILKNVNEIYNMMRVYHI